MSDLVTERSNDWRGAAAAAQLAPGDPARTRFTTISPSFIAAFVVIAAAFIWSYAGTIHDLIREWNNSPNYSVGMIIPFAALYLLIVEREKLARIPLRPALSGLIVIAAAQGVRFFGLARLYESAERYSIVLTVAGVVLLVGGWRVLSAVKYIILLLLLMVPFPSAVHNAISNPLQDLATNGAVVALELLGVSVSQEGHVLVLNGRAPIAIAEACSGLRMLTAFIFVSAMMACISRGPAWQKVVVLLSSVPIAILVNLMRLVATALLYLWTSNRFAERFGHDFAGWIMMPVAIALLALELWVLGKLELPPEPEEKAASPHSRTPARAGAAVPQEGES